MLFFLDESALTIGPNMDAVLDESVYDPEAELGTLFLNATKGVFRLIGGKISKKSAVVLTTPTALPAPSGRASRSIEISF
jgi:hypothetical protein